MKCHRMNLSGALFCAVLKKSHKRESFTSFHEMRSIENMRSERMRGRKMSIKYQQFRLNVYALKIFPNYSSYTNTHAHSHTISIVIINVLAFAFLRVCFLFLRVEETLRQLYGIFGKNRKDVQNLNAIKLFCFIFLSQ